MTPTKLLCKYCGKGFESLRRDRRFCGALCCSKDYKTQDPSLRKALPRALQEQLSKAYERMKERQP